MKHILYIIKRHVRLYFAYLKMRLTEKMAYRTSFYMEGFVNLFHAVLMLLFINFLYGSVSNISGWHYEEAMFITGTWMIIQGLCWLFLVSGLWRLDYTLKQGTFDVLLMRPAHPLVLLGFKGTNPEFATETVVGAFVIIRYIVMHAVDFSLLYFLLYIIALALGFILCLSFLVIVKTLTFYFTDAWSLSHFVENVMEFGRYPNEIFRYTLLKIITNTIVPIAFIGTVPARIFLHDNTFQNLGLAMIVTFCMFFIARFFWRMSVKKYSSASS